MAPGQKKKRDIEPIMAISMVVFLLASVAVLAVFVNDNYISGSDSDTVQPGSTVTVDYAGSLYAYYNEDGALIFDTNVKAYSENYPIKGDFSKTTFSDYTVIPGSGGALTMFENALIGHKVGDTVKVLIPSADGYASKSITRDDQFSVPTVQYMSQTQFSSLYDFTVSAGAQVEFKTIYGWDATAVYSSDRGGVSIINKPVKGETYQLASNDLNDYGTANLTVDTMGDEIVCTIGVEGIDSDPYKMVWVNLESEKFYVQSNSGSVLTITTDPSAGEDLYFVIKIKSIA
ncbi:MAG: FKBP-type peptidyl-prolyl cis-trans isomerase [Methanomassiliicoccaceae archaeon]|nr:FKBP-type peptidyl-prolyl cis-trans isomerase [Methanomassiliicoccaceae archaeon]